MGKSIDVLPVITALADEDLLYARVAAEPDSTADSAIQVGSLFGSRDKYGQLYLDINNPVANVPVTTTPSVITAFDSSGPSKTLTSNTTTGTITIPAGTPTAVYSVSFSTSFDGSANTAYGVGVFSNGALSSISSFLDLSNSQTTGGCVSASGIATIDAGAEIQLSIWVASGTATVDIGTLMLTVRTI
jgi:hypothetical protein